MAMQFEFSDLPSIENLRILLGRLNFRTYLYDENSYSSSYVNYASQTASFSAFSCYADLEWTGTIQNGNTYVNSTASSTVPLPPSILTDYSFKAESTVFA